MSSHIDVLVGRWQQSIETNFQAVLADEKWLKKGGRQNFYTYYRIHNLAMAIYSACFGGQFKAAMAAVEMLEKALPRDLLESGSPPFADWLEGSLGTKMHVLVRFGKWKDIFELQSPDDQAFYCQTTTMIHYAKGIAYAATGQVAEAEEQLALFQRAASQVPPTRMEFPNKYNNINVLAEHVLFGEIEYRKGNDKHAFTILREAMKLEDGLLFIEPWPWMMPVRHVLAALLLEQGNVEEARVLYMANLGLSDEMPRARQHPNNVWALHGLRESLVKLGRKAEAQLIEQPLRIALAAADVSIKASCACRLDVKQGTASLSDN